MNATTFVGFQRRVMDLAPSLRTAALEVLWAVNELIGEATEAGIVITDRRIAEKLKASKRPHRSLRFVQKGLWALQWAWGQGQGLILRIRTEGRRLIRFLVDRVAGLLGKDDMGDPPQTPPNSNSSSKDTTSTSASSSSSKINPEGSRETTPELIARAMALLPKGKAKPGREATPNKVRRAVETYGADWVDRALDCIDTHEQTPGNAKVYSWGFVLRTLNNFDKQGFAPDKPELVPAAVIHRRPAAPARSESKPLTQQQLADLVAQCQEKGNVGAINRKILARAITEGLIADELVVTIPDELLANVRSP
jgi:hypothetical protein